MNLRIFFSNEYLDVIFFGQQFSFVTFIITGKMLTKKMREILINF